MKICKLNSAKISIHNKSNRFLVDSSLFKHYLPCVVCYMVWYAILNPNVKNNNKVSVRFDSIGRQFVYIKLNIDSNPSNKIFIDPTDLNVYGFLEQKQRPNKIQHTECSVDRLDRWLIIESTEWKFVFMI